MKLKRQAWDFGKNFIDSVKDKELALNPEAQFSKILHAQ